MAIEGGYAPPGVYTQTVFEENNTNLAQLQGRVPTLIGVGKQTFEAKGRELVRGSSATIDQRIVEEDPTGRMISGTNPDGSLILASYDGEITKLLVRNFPIVTGDGTGTSSTTPSSVTATINGNATVILEVDGANGIIRLAEAPSEGDDVRVSYFFNRTDTLVEDEVLTSQVSEFQTEILGSAGDFVITDQNNTLIITCDGVTGVITLGVDANRASSLDKVENAINGAEIGSLVASTYVDQNGSENLILSANGEILIGEGTANLAVGIYKGQTGTPRATTFFTANKPIVDGSNGGIPTTNVDLITVKVNDVEVRALTVDGNTGSFTLASAPLVGSTLTVTYHHNTFRDQFDYIPGRDVKSIDRVALTPSEGGEFGKFTQNIDFVLHNDRIVWGTAVLVSNGLIQEGDVAFGTSQVTASLRDEKAFLLECSPVIDTSVIPSRVLAKTFKLPYQPVDGTGRGLPTSNPSLITVRTGVSFADALENPVATITKVDAAKSQITLATAPPTNHKVFATFFYSVIQDKFDLNAYNVVVNTVGASGIGTYGITTGSSSLFSPTLTAKGTDLTEVVVEFPSGSEAQPGARVAQVGTPVEETITLEFGDFDPTPASLFVEGSAPYYLVPGQTDTLELTIDQQGVTVEFDQPTEGGRLGSLCHVVSEVLPYTPGSDNQNFGDAASTSVDLVVDGKAFGSAGFTAQNAQTVSNLVSAINDQAALVSPSYTAMSSFSAWAAIDDGGVADTYRKFSFTYTGSTNNTFAAPEECEIPAAVYPNASLLAEAIETEMNAHIADRVAAEAKFDGLQVSVTADTSGRLVFSITSLPDQGLNVDDFGYIEFIGAAQNTTFLSIAGIDFDTAAGGTQTKFGFLPVASKVSTDLGGPLRDRLILKNRILPGNFYYPPTNLDLGISVTTGTNLDLMGISKELDVSPSRTSVLDKPSILLNVGWDDVDEATGIPAKKLYDGTGETAANNVLSIVIDGIAINHTFAGANGAGAELDIKELIDALNNDADFNTHASARIEGHSIRIISNNATTNSYLKVGNGSANSAFGLTNGTIISTVGLPAQAVADGFMSSVQNNNNIKLALFSVDQENNLATKFGDNAVALIHTNAVGKQYVGIESLEAGVSSILNVTGGNIAERKGTGLKITTSTGAVGEAAIQGFNVVSNNGAGSGSANTSTLKNGVGADGRIGQTYTDSVTGFSITILPRAGGISYPTGVNSRLTFSVGTSITTNANIPVFAIPGVSLVVTNTLDTQVADNAVIETFYKEGEEPNIGQTYYIDFTRDRSSFNTRTFTNLADVLNTYGPISPENTLSMGAFLAFSNGATSLACKQIQLSSDQTTPTIQQMIAALQEIEGEIVPGLAPSVLMPLVPATTSLLSAISNHCDVQSSIRYRSERRAVLGVAVGTQPRDVQALAQATGNSRICLIYPDMARIRYSDENGITQSYLVGGEMVAVAVALATSNPGLDSATPWTNRAIAGFTELGRTLDDVEANATANAGVTVLKQTVNGIQVRHGLTTNMTSVLTKTPTVVQIADDVHLRVRNLCNRYIGLKFVPQTVQQIEGRVNNLFKQLVRDQVIATYTGLSVQTDPNDPTGLLVDVFYKPVFPLLYIQFTFTVQGS